MAQPRFRKYTELAAKRDRKPVEIASVSPGVRRGCITLLVIVLLGIFLYTYLRTVPMQTSTAGDYYPPGSIENVEPFSRARWFLSDAQGDVLGTNLAWYHRSQLSPARTTAELEVSGFSPFLFVDEQGKRVPVMDHGAVLQEPAEPFLFQLVLLQGTNAGYIKHRSIEYTNLFHDAWEDAEIETILVNPQDDTSIHGQFLPDSAQFAEEYMCYMAQLWEAAATGYIEIYQRPPSSLEDLMNGIGLVPNPDCAWPFADEERLTVDCEGGVIDGKIIYWRVTHAGGARRGMARYWDQYTTYDDPDTPQNIVTVQTTSSVVDPGLIEGTFHVLFSEEILKNLLDSVRPVPVEEDAP